MADYQLAAGTLRVRHGKGNKTRLAYLEGSGGRGARRLAGAARATARPTVLAPG